MTKKILIIDENKSYLNKVKNRLEINLDIECNAIDNYDDIQSTQELFSYTIYLIRVNEKTDSLIKKLSEDNKTVILLTENSDDKINSQIRAYGITDYILTSSTSRGDIALKIIKRVLNNSKITIMIVDDSKVILSNLSILLQTQNINYVQCLDGKEAWEYIQNPISQKIDLVITDYEMPIMNGYELTQHIRTLYPMEELPVLILSGTEDKSMIARFLKIGANDYISKPFINEELIARVSNTLTLLEMFKNIKKMAMTDNLTGIHNRNYFYQAASQQLLNAKRYKHPLALAMIDIDNFKSINDIYGHNSGDKALKHITKIIKNLLRETDIFARFGGEEFVLMLQGSSGDDAYALLEKIVKSVEKSPFILDDSSELIITISSGLTSKIDTIDNMIARADKFLYQAKQNGKNRVVTQK